MGQISTALERHDKENTVKLEDLKQELPKRLVVEKPEAHVFEEAVLKREVRGKLVTLTDPDSAEAKSPAQHVEGIIFVVMANKTPKKEIEKAMDNIGREKSSASSSTVTNRSVKVTTATTTTTTKANNLRIVDSSFQPIGFCDLSGL